MASKQDLKYKIKLAVGEAPWPLIECFQCRSVAGRYKPHATYPWCMKLFCGSCTEDWHVCTQCVNQRVHLKDKNSIARHKRLRHKEDATLPSTISSRNSSKASSSDNSTLKLESIQSQGPPPNTFHRPASQVYFEREHSGYGLIYLVGNASFKTNQIVLKIDPLDTKMLMSVALLVTTLTKDQREQVASVLHHTTSTAIRHHELPGDGAKAKASEASSSSSSTNSTKWKVRVPTTAEDIRSVICEGKHSLFHNLPHPTIHQRDDHAYMLPSECIQDFFGHGLISRKLSSLVPFPPCDTIFESPDSNAMRSCYGLPGKHQIFLTTWSDDFKPNYAKSNRGSVWMRTLTIHTQTNTHISLTHVYPIAVGTKDSNHDAIDRILFDDITDNQLRPMDVYNGDTKQMETVSIHLSLSVQDQPERRSCNRLLLGGSNHHVRWGWRSNPSETINGLVACSDCREALFTLNGDMKWTPFSCDMCSNWMWFSNHKNIRFKPPEKFPTEELENDGYLPTIPLTYDHLKDIVRKCHQKVEQGDWNKGTAAAYLSVNGLNNSTINQIYDCASNCAAMRRATTENNQQILQDIEDDKAENPEKYQEWTFPPSWDTGLEIQDSTEAGMHILFLGVTKRIVTEIQEGMAMRKKGSSVRRQLRKLTKQIEGMHLPWCKVQEYYGEKLGGWVSENYMGFARLLPWAYSCIQTCTADDVYIEPTKPMQKWTAQENRAWLRARGLDTSGLAAILRVRVQGYTASGNAPPILPPRGPTNLETSNLITATTNMLSLMMGMVKVSNIEVNVMERLVRVFLTCVHHYDQAMKVADRSPIVVAAYNFLCLLNIPGQVSKHGPLRNRWEGGLLGEGLLRIVKPVVQSSKRKNWHSNLLTNLCRQKTLLTMTAQTVPDTQSETQSTIDLPRGSEYNTYSSYAKLYLDFVNGAPLSILVHEEFCENANKMSTEFYAVYLISGQKYLCGLTPDAPSSTKLGMVYAAFKIRTIDASDSRKFEDLKGISYGILLPMLQQDQVDVSDEADTPSRFYTCIDCQWRQLTEHFSLDLPHRISIPSPN